MKEMTLWMLACFGVITLICPLFLASEAARVFRRFPLTSEVVAKAGKRVSIIHRVATCIPARIWGILEVFPPILLWFILPRLYSEVFEADFSLRPGSGVRSTASVVTALVIGGAAAVGGLFSFALHGVAGTSVSELLSRRRTTDNS